MDNIPNYKPTTELQAIDSNHHMHPFTDGEALKKKGARVITSASGIYLIDSEGNKLLDAMSGLWCVNIGYGRHELADVAQHQMKQLPYYNTFFQTSHPPVISLSEKLAEISPSGFNNVFYGSSGSEANDTTVKLLWFINRRKGKPDRRKIITRINSYHGVTAVSASMTGKPYNSEFGLPLDGFLHAACPHYWKYSEQNESEEEFTKRMGEDLENLIQKEGADTIAGYFAEPVMGAGGVIPPSQGYFDVVQKILNKYDIPFIADEVICGFGRTGNLWGSQTYNIQPDILIASKCITSGF
mgnify:CR=1 FL=1